MISFGVTGCFQDWCTGKDRTTNDKPVGTKFEDKEEGWHEDGQRETAGDEVRESYIKYIRFNFCIWKWLCLLLNQIYLIGNIISMAFGAEVPHLKKYTSGLIEFNQIFIEDYPLTLDRMYNIHDKST